MSNITSLQFFIPELILSGTSILLLCLAAIKGITPHPQPSPLVGEGKGEGAIASYIASAGLLAALVFGIMQWGTVNEALFMNMLTLDKPAEFFRVIFIVTALAIIVFSRRSRELISDIRGKSFPLLCKEGLGEVDLPHPTSPYKGEEFLTPKSNSFDDAYEYYSLILGLVVGMSLLAQARNLLMIYLSLEFVGLISYVLVGFAKDSVRSSEAGLKYMLFGAVASGVFLFGASIFYGLTGTLDIISSPGPTLGSIIAYVVAGLFMLGGFLFKIAAVPMHAWCPDAYEGAPTPITALLSVAPKAAGFAVLIRVFGAEGFSFGWPFLIAIVSTITMTFGNLAAIPQMNVKRLLAYSSIAHAGYLLMGIACATPKGNEAVYFYFIAYLLMNLGAFLVVQIMSNKTGSEDISAFVGIARCGPFGAAVAIAMTIFLLSLTGVPPFVGFIGKFYLFSAVIDAKLYWLAIVGIANSVVSLYYYMRIVKAMFFDAPQPEYSLSPEGIGTPSLLTILSLAVVIFGLAWSPIAYITKSLII